MMLRLVEYECTEVPTVDGIFWRAEVRAELNGELCCLYWTDSAKTKAEALSVVPQLRTMTLDQVCKRLAELKSAENPQNA